MKIKDIICEEETDLEEIQDQKVAYVNPGPMSKSSTYNHPYFQKWREDERKKAIGNDKLS